ncbi:MAG: hypothetical protein HRU09_16630 [Oligoflexales bacterium]|nr:hypothetical protein [Oligoflexales bacterium]
MKVPADSKNGNGKSCFGMRTKMISTLLASSLCLGTVSTQAVAGSFSAFDGFGTVWEDLSIGQHVAIWGTISATTLGGALGGYVIGSVMNGIINSDSKGGERFVSLITVLLGAGGGALGGYFIALNAEDKSLELQPVPLDASPEYLDKFSEEQILEYNAHVTEFNTILKEISAHIDDQASLQNLDSISSQDYINELYHDYVKAGVLSMDSLEVGAAVLESAFKQQCSLKWTPLSRPKIALYK